MYIKNQSLLMAAVFSPGISSSYADDTCPKFHTKDEVNDFMSDISRAVMIKYKNPALDRWVFKYDDTDWFLLPTSYVEFKGSHKLAVESIIFKNSELIDTGLNEDGKKIYKLRCMYSAEGEYVFQVLNDIRKDSYPFYITKVILRD